MLKRLDIAREVIAGMGGWGSGTTRVERLRKAGYNPDQVQGDVNTLLCCRENIIGNIKAMAHKMADNDNWWYIYWDEQYGHECAICHPHGGENHGWQCIGAGIATWHHGGIPIYCNCGVIDNGTGEEIYLARTDAEALRIARNAMGINEIKVIRNNGKAIPKAQAQAGDIALMFVGKDTFQHLYVIMSQSKIFDSTTGCSRANQISADRSFSGDYVNGMRVLIRYTGNGLCPPPQRTIDQLAYEVIEGLWGSGDSRVTALTQAGHDYNAVQNRVNEILDPQPKPEPTPKPSIATLVAVDVINGDYGNGDERYTNLRRAGYNPDVIQAEVNRLMTESKKKSIDTLAHEVINGFWKSGKKREKVLKACGCNYDAIQNRVNEILNPTDKKSYGGKYPTWRLTKTNAQVIADTIEWAKWIAGDNRFHYGYGEHAHHNGCYFCGTQDMKKGHGIVDPDFTYCCNPFVGAAWAHGGGDATAYRMCHNYSSWDFNKGSGYDASSKFIKLGRPTLSKLKAGDVLCNGSHVALYIGNGKIAEASGGDDNVRNSRGWNNSIHVTDVDCSDFDRAYRYDGNVDCDRPLSYGEVSDRVGDLQRYLIWGGWLAQGEDDREFGDKTLTATKKMQGALGVDPDGWVGQDTLKAMAAYTK